MDKVYFIGSLRNPSIPLQVYPDTFDGRKELVDDLLMDLDIHSITGTADQNENFFAEKEIEDLILTNQIDDVNDIIRFDGLKIHSLNLACEIDLLFD